MRIAWTIALIVMIGVSVQADTKLCIQNDLETGTKTVDLLVTSNGSQQIGSYLYALSTDGWGEVLVGTTWSPRPYVQLALGYGLEQAPKSGRAGAWLWLGKGKFSFIHIYEDGGSGTWHKTELDYQLNSRVSVGLVDKTSWGQGVVVGYATGQKEKVSLFVCEDTTTLALSRAF